MISNDPVESRSSIQGVAGDHALFYKTKTQIEQQQLQMTSAKKKN